MTTPGTAAGGGGVISSGDSTGESVPILFHLQALREGDAFLNAERERRLVELDKRYQARFEAQELAMNTALTAAKEATASALAAAEKAVQTALAAAAKAVDKAENATEKRFESVNEFRQSLSDQTALFPSKAELVALGDQLIDLKDRITRIEAARLGGQESRTESRNQNAALYAAVGFVVSLILAAVVIVGFIAANGGP